MGTPLYILLILLTLGILVIAYFVFTLIALVRKRRDGRPRLKSAITMFVVAGFCVVLMIFGFIDMGKMPNSQIGGSRSDDLIVTILVLFLSVAYSCVGGFLLIRESKRTE